jgi:two-component system, OmpR family, sensor kinase
VSARPRSIVVPMVALVIAAALLATLVQFAMMFNGPPPGGGPVSIVRVAEVLRTGEVPPEAANRLTVTRTTSDTFGRPDERPSPARDAAIARLVQRPADQIQGAYLFPMRGPMADPNGDLMGSFTVAMQDGAGWIVVASAPRPAFTGWHGRRLLSMAATLVLLSLLAWSVARRISRPIRELAHAATRARIGAREPMPMGGPREVRELAEAIAAMQARILQQAEGRTVMLAAIAHDLGTPLSRIAFWIEQLPDEARDRAAADIEEMRAMLGAALRFTRDDQAQAAHARLDLGSLIESLADDLATAGTPVTVEPGPRAVVRGDPAGLRRLFANLIENAVRYGDYARIDWRLVPGAAEVRIEDDGPGFPADNPEALFAPFVRGEGSRNRATGGTGLGLAIVRSIAEAHGGKALLENRPEGGGRVRVILPVE